MKVKAKNYRLMDYLFRGFLIVYGVALLLGLVVFPVLKANSILQ